AYLLGVAFSLDIGVVRDTWRLLAGSVAFGSVIVVSAGTLMLAISSLSRNSRLVGAAWIALWVVSNVTANVLMETVKRDWCPLAPSPATLDGGRGELLDTASPRRKFLGLWEAGRARAREAARPVFPFGIGRRRRRPPPPPTEDPPTVLQTPE